MKSFHAVMPAVHFWQVATVDDDDHTSFWLRRLN